MEKPLTTKLLTPNFFPPWEVAKKPKALERRGGQNKSNRREKRPGKWPPLLTPHSSLLTSNF
jgi:hypothetical protein